MGGKKNKATVKSHEYCEKYNICRSCSKTIKIGRKLETRLLRGVLLMTEQLMYELFFISNVIWINRFKIME